MSDAINHFMSNYSKPIFKAFAVALGASLCLLMFAKTSFSHTEQNAFSLKKLSQRVGALFHDISTLDQAEQEPKTVLKVFHHAQTKVPADFERIHVQDARGLYAAIKKANKLNGQTAIILAPGVYKISKTILIQAPHIMLLSSSENPYDTVLKGIGMMHSPRVNNLITVRASDFVLDGIRLQDAPNHLIQIAAENNANRPIIRNCILQDSYEQLLKVSYDQLKRPKNIAYDGIVEHCIFQYTRGIAPNYYTGGIDALGVKNWRVENNIFKDIASPAKSIAQHAVHFWVNSSGNLVRNNIFIDNDRAIGFGMKLKKHQDPSLDYYSKGGTIEGNVIYHANNDDPFADTGIILEASPNTVIKDNYILMLHDYPNAIEYRFAETQGAKIENNSSNKAISSRDGGQAELRANRGDMDSLVFFEELRKKMDMQKILTLAEPLVDKHTDD